MSKSSRIEAVKAIKRSIARSEFLKGYRILCDLHSCHMSLSDFGDEQVVYQDTDHYEFEAATDIEERQG